VRTCRVAWIYHRFGGIYYLHVRDIQISRISTYTYLLFYGISKWRNLLSCYVNFSSHLNSTPTFRRLCGLVLNIGDVLLSHVSGIRIVCTGCHTKFRQMVICEHCNPRIKFVDFKWSWPCIEQWDVISKPTNVRKCVEVYFTHYTPLACFSHSCHIQGDSLQRIDTSRYYRSFWINARI
jgi:hypothetical protein